MFSMKSDPFCPLTMQSLTRSSAILTYILCDGRCLRERRLLVVVTALRPGVRSSCSLPVPRIAIVACVGCAKNLLAFFVIHF
jgi:hypothetical protein